MADDNELGVFLRSRREAVSPVDVGLPIGTRRRAPGLRRAELATLAGISVDYLTRIEQGRDRHPSAQVLAALSDALRLSADDRLHLRLIAKAAGGHICGAAEPPARTVRPTVRMLLERLEPAPAVLLNRLTEILAHTTGYGRIAGPVGILDRAGGEPPNLTRFVFTDPRARAAYPDWDRVADRLVGGLRVESYRDDPHVAELVSELSIGSGAPFTGRFAGPPALPRRTGAERLAHPEAGELRLAYETLELPDADEQRLIVYLPADEATSTALARLTRPRPGMLRAVTG